MSKSLDSLNRRMKAIPVAVRQAVIPALSLSGDELKGRMKVLAPEDTGDLKDSITATMPGQSTPPYSQPGGSRVAGPLEVVVTAGNEKVRYPHLVEYGTADTKAQAFFWPAYRLSKKRIASRIKRAISKAVKQGWQT